MANTFQNYVHCLTFLIKIFSKISHSAFHRTFDKRFWKFVWNSWSLGQTWQFHYVADNQIANFETKLWMPRQTLLGIAKFSPIQYSVVGFGKYITTIEFKFSTKQGLLYDVYFRYVNYMRGTERLCIANRWFVSGLY